MKRVMSDVLPTMDLLARFLCILVYHMSSNSHTALFT